MDSAIATLERMIDSATDERSLDAFQWLIGARFDDNDLTLREARSLSDRIQARRVALEARDGDADMLVQPETHP